MDWEDIAAIFSRSYRMGMTPYETPTEPQQMSTQPQISTPEPMPEQQSHNTVAAPILIDARGGIPQSQTTPLLPVSSASPFNIAEHAAKYAGNVGYKMGAKDINSGAVDCSGLVCDVTGMSGASADIIQNLSRGTKFELANPTIDQLQDNMIIGLDADPKRAGGKGYKGIDHVAIVFTDPKDGRKKIYESNGKQGVTTTDAEKYLERYRGRGVPMFAVNPILMK